MKARDTAVAIVAIIFLVCVMTSHAAELYLGGWSTHLTTPDAQYNQDHQLVGIEHKRVFVARFLNSYARESYAAAYAWHRDRGYLRLSLYAGGVYGYRECYGDDGDKARLCPLLVLMASYTRYQVQPAVFLMGDAAVFAVKFSF